MAALTVRLPQEKLDRLREMAEARSVSVNKLNDELATVALADHDARTRFEVRSARGNPTVALELLARMDQVDGEGQIGLVGPGFKGDTRPRRPEAGGSAGRVLTVTRDPTDYSVQQFGSTFLRI